MIIRIRLPSCPLFEGIAPEALLEELARLQAAERKYKAGETLLAAGSPTSRMGLVLEGELHAILPLPQGRQLLQSRLLRGELFGQLLALDGERESPVTVTAHTPCRVLWIPMKNLLAGGGTPSSARLLSNLCRQLSSAYFSLQRRLICLTQPTLRERLLYYLRTECYTQGSRTVRLPFDRAGLADYLGADRSALSRVLSGLRQKAPGRHYTAVPTGGLNSSYFPPPWAIRGFPPSQEYGIIIAENRQKAVKTGESHHLQGGYLL